MLRVSIGGEGAPPAPSRSTTIWAISLFILEMVRLFCANEVQLLLSSVLPSLMRAHSSARQSTSSSSTPSCVPTSRDEEWDTKMAWGKPEHAISPGIGETGQGEPLPEGWRLGGGGAIIILRVLTQASCELNER